MTCPSCGGELVSGADRCPVCDASIAPRTEGALATDPRLVTPPARGRAKTEPADGEPIREIPGLRRREGRERAERSERADRSWRDEVQERIRSRRQKRTEAGLPLFEQDAVQVRPSSPDETVPPGGVGPAPDDTIAPSAEHPLRRPVAPATVPAPAAAAFEPVTQDPDVFSPSLSEAELADLPLRTSQPAQGPAELAPSTVELQPAAVEFEAARQPPPRTRARPVPPPLDDDVLVADADLEPGLDLAPPPGEPSPLERPARAGERAQAAAFDLALFAAMATLIVYFAGRAARVELQALAASWPWVLGFLALLAGFYACYFTGTTGQTPGKLITGLRVVDAGGRPPGYPRALARALVGLLGVAVGGAGVVPMAFDPAGRALHDRLFRTRVVRR